MNSELQVTTQTEHSPIIFDTTTPALVVQKATGIANQLTDIIEKAKLYSDIKGKKYVRVEGWTTMLAMLGIFPHVEYCRKLDLIDETAYEARVVLKTMDGKIVGSGEAICSSRERNWGNRDEFAIKSMAQTRGTGKAGRIGFSWIMALAGYDTTPAEEMTYEHTPAIHKVEPEEQISNDAIEPSIPDWRAETREGIVPKKKEPNFFPPQQVWEQKEGCITQKQAARFFAIAKKGGKTNADIKSYLFDLGIEHSRDMKWQDYEKACEWGEVK